MSTCTCPKRTENGFLTRVGRDVFCPAHGAPQTVRQESGADVYPAIPVSASADKTGAPCAPTSPQDVPSAAARVPQLSAGCDAIAEAQRQIIQTPERAREALARHEAQAAVINLEGERFD